MTDIIVGQPATSSPHSRALMMIHAPNPSTVVKYASIYSMSDLLPYGGRPS